MGKNKRLPKPPKLLPWHIDYIREYVSTGGDKMLAYRRAKNRPDLPDQHCSAAVSALMKSSRGLIVQNEIDELVAQKKLVAQESTAGASRENILAELAEIAFDPNARAIHKLKALELLGKDIGMFKAPATSVEEDPASLTIVFGGKDGKAD